MKIHQPHRKAIAHLKRADASLARVIERVGPCRFGANSAGTHFEAVVRSIIYQQLSGKAARTIHARFQALYGGCTPTPAELLSTSVEQLRSVGLSRQKIAYLQDLAAKVQCGAVPIETLHELTDEQIIDALTRIKGVGRWTAQMFLMFRLGRPNVLPELDLGVRKAIMGAYQMRALPTPQQIARLGAKWQPYCTIASWYLWRSLELAQEPSLPTRIKRAGGTRAAGR
jgi:DNA-3-methyladenine glycosylase II